MIIRYNQILELNTFLKKYSEVSKILFKFKIIDSFLFYNFNFSDINKISFLLKTKSIYFNFIYFYFILFFNKYLLKDIFFKNYLYLNFKLFKQFFFFLYYLKLNNNSIIFFDKNNYNFISKSIFNSKSYYNLDTIFNFFLVSKKIKVFIFVDKSIYNLFKMKYSDYDVIILFFPFNNDIFKYFLNNLIYRIY